MSLGIAENSQKHFKKTKFIVRHAGMRLKGSKVALSQLRKVKNVQTVMEARH
jgi:hypothetical protein